MKRRVLVSAMLLSATTVFAQSNVQTTQSVSVEQGGNVPVTTVVPVQQKPVVIVDTTSQLLSAPIPNRTTRVEKRADEEKRFSEYIDSLVRSRNFMFYPDSMQEVDPDGAMRLIYAEYFYFGFFTDTAEIHLPTSQGVTQYVQILNFDSPITDYKLLPFQSGLSVTFKLMYEDKPYFGRFIVSTVTGETVLTLITPAMTMRYVGWLSYDRHTPVHKLKASEPVEDLPPVNRKSPTHKQHHRK